MNTRTDSTIRIPTHRKLWSAAFHYSATTLLVCLLVMFVYPVVAPAPAWVYVLAIGSGTVCIVAAVRLRNQQKLDAAEDAAWLAKVQAHDTKDLPDGFDGVDD